MGDQGSGRRGEAKCWRLDRGSLVKKVWLANIWGSGGSVRWTAGRDALARAQKAGGRPEGSTPVSKVLARISKKRNPVSGVVLFIVRCARNIVRCDQE